MKKISKITIALILILGSINIYAQQAPMFTHYMYNTLMVNPAYAGSRDALTVTALHRSQWIGFEGAPLTQSLTIHTPLNSEHIGIGLSVSNDKIGPTNNTSLFGHYAFIFRLTAKSKLALGLSAGVNIFQANLSNLQLDQQSDPAFQNNVSNHVNPNVGVGAYYSRERFYAGISAPGLLQNDYYRQTQVDGSTLAGKEQLHYYFIAGTLINLSDNLGFKPTTLIKATAAAPIQADLTASFVFCKKFQVGAMVRTGDAVGALVGIDLTDQLQIGYSFDWSYGLKTAKYNQGSHELMLRYDFIYFDKRQIHSPRNF